MKQRHVSYLALSLSSDSDDISSSTYTPTVNESNGDGDGASSNNEEMQRLQKENKLLQQRLKLLQEQNDQLLKQTSKSKQKSNRDGDGEGSRIIEQRVILEDFEGESKKSSAFTFSEADNDELGMSEQLEEDEVCEYDDTSKTWLNGFGECPVEPSVTFIDAMKSRASWLVGLLALQSCSGFILSRNELLLQAHPVIIYFLTMLVGAGGNAGNQASVRVIRGLALGTLNASTQLQFLSREFRMAFALSVILSLAGFLRAVLFQTPFPETIAVTLALSMIVFSSICLGAVLPLLLQKVGVDPAHSSTTIQVIMDILGVVLTVFISTLVLDNGFGKTLIATMARITGL